MAEMTVRVVNATVPTLPLYSTAVMNPAIKGVYLHSLAAVPGTAAAQNFISLFNPAGSGRNISLGTVALSYSNSGTGTSVDPLRGWRISAASGGTLVAPSALGKFVSTYPTPIAEVRIDNPTTTNVVPVFNSPAPLDNKSSSVHTVDIPPGAGPFLMAPGEGLVIRKDTGDTTVAWNITLVWAEL